MRLIHDFFSELSGAQRLFAFVFVILTTTMLLCLWTQGLFATVVLTLLVVLVLWITKDVWTNHDGNTAVRKASIAAVLVAAAGSSKWNTLYSSKVFKPILLHIKSQYPELFPYKIPESIASIEVLCIVLTAIFLINYLMRDKSVMLQHPDPIDKEFPEKDYRKRLGSFCRMLGADLDKIDIETNWSDEHFTPLDAEVEIYSNNSKSKKVTDLLSALKSVRKREVFLVLGDPGSGKSVSLRKLCKDLLKEVPKTGKIPIYINLREWEPATSWSEERPPTPEQLFDFMVSNLKSRGDVFFNDFIDKYFKKMFEHGRLFLVLDSFDEIPAVLDVNESSWIIEHLSDVIYRFMAGAHESRGILSSRIFRKPTKSFQAKTVLEIRPFSEIQIISFLRKNLYFDERIVSDIFKERHELITVAKNPFTAALISSYVRDNHNKLPNNQAELYRSYIEKRLSMCEDRLFKKNISKQDVISCAIDIAAQMFETHHYGLEADLDVLAASLPQHRISDICDILKYSRLGRFGSGDSHRFSFTHRRFNEYFISLGLINDPAKIPRESIPTDSRWRDALVLYCEIAEKEEATSLANFCWSEISKVDPERISLTDADYLRSIHCLRFLNDAFRNKAYSYSSFSSELSCFVRSQINSTSSVIATKVAVEAVGLLDKENLESAIIEAMDIGNPWINETALKSCRHLSSLSSQLERRIKEYLLSIDSLECVARRKELQFSLSLSPAFQNILRFYKLRLLEIYLLAIGFGLLFVVSYRLGLLILIFLLVSKYFGRLLMSPWLIGTGESFSRYMIGFCSAGAVFLWLKDEIKGTNYLSMGPAFLSPAGVVSVSVLTLALTLPWLQISHDYKAALKEHRLFLFLYLPVAFVGYEIWYSLVTHFLFFRRVAEWMFEHQDIYFFISKCLLIGGPALLLCAWSYFIITELLQVRKHLKKADITRADIAMVFEETSSRIVRTYFIRHLIQHDVRLLGEWPDGIIPNLNDDASTFLAKLEAKNLGLD